MFSYAIVACNTTHLESLGKRLVQTIESQPKLACFHVLPIHNKTCEIQCLNFGIPIFQQISKVSDGIYFLSPFYLKFHFSFEGVLPLPNIGFSSLVPFLVLPSALGSPPSFNPSVVLCVHCTISSSLSLASWGGANGTSFVSCVGCYLYSEAWCITKGMIKLFMLFLQVVPLAFWFSLWALFHL